MSGYAQTNSPRWQQWYGDRKLLIDLLNDGYEIKAAVRLSDADILYVQKGGSAYRCLSLAVGSTVQHTCSGDKIAPIAALHGHALERVGRPYSARRRD